MQAMIPSHRQDATDAGPTEKPAPRKGRDFVARHGETVFNAAHRLQGDAAHTPLTRAGFAQADAIGRALRDLLGPRPALTLWTSPTGRALQTLAVVVEHLELDWHAVRTDPRLGELDFGSWGGLTYAEIAERAAVPLGTAKSWIRRGLARLKECLDRDG